MKIHLSEPVPCIRTSMVKDHYGLSKLDVVQVPTKELGVLEVALMSALPNFNRLLDSAIGVTRDGQIIRFVAGPYDMVKNPAELIKRYTFKGSELVWPLVDFAQNHHCEPFTSWLEADKSLTIDLCRNEVKGNGRIHFKHPRLNNAQMAALLKELPVVSVDEVTITMDLG